MVQSVLGSISLRYQPMWGRQRDLAAVRLHVAGEPGAFVDAPHLVRTIDEIWTREAPPLLLRCETPALLADLLAHAAPTRQMLEVESEWLADGSMAALVLQAHRRGLQLVWRGPIRQVLPPELAPGFSRHLLRMEPEDAAIALKAAIQQRRYPNAPSSAFLRSPVRPHHFYENIASYALIGHCLDHKHALALLGWPDEDVLHAHRMRDIAPSRKVIERALSAISADQSMEVIEDILSEEPLLCWRFLTLANSAALGLRTGIDSLRHGLMMMGYTQLGQWLRSQLSMASTDPDLQPVRFGMVLRAKLMQHILDAGIESELRREVYLCGLLSQLDLLMGEPLGAILSRLPLSDRIYAANITQSGPYVAALDLARAMAGPDTAELRRLRQAHETSTEDLNRALLHMLVGLRVSDSARPLHEPAR